MSRRELTRQNRLTDWITMSETKEIIRGRAATNIVKSELERLFSGITVYVRQKKTRNGPTLSLKWIDGPSNETMQRAITRIVNVNNLCLSCWPEMDRQLSLKGELLFASLLEISAGKVYRAGTEYLLDYDYDKKQLVTSDVPSQGYTLAYRWSICNDLPVY
jgi:hypothetical protein